MHTIKPRTAHAAIALSLGLMLGACSTASGPANTSLYSVKQPVVERTNYTLDLSANTSGLPITEQRRLAGWFESVGLRYGDRVAIEDGLNNPAVTDNVAGIAGRYGILLSEGTPVTPGFIAPGNVRVVITRSTAHVPGCPDWSNRSASNLGNATSSGYGCAVNSNLAAMVANPEHLLNGAAGTGETVVMSSSKAIASFREQAPTGAGGLPEISSQGN